MMKSLRGKVAVVTGSAGGLGRGLAVHLAQEGCAVALVDVDERGLRQSAEQCRHAGSPSVSEHVVDVASRDEVGRLREEVLDRHGSASILINNAGVSIAGALAEQSLDNYDWIVGVNLMGPVYLCHAFIPILRQQPEAHIVNVASEFAFVGFPTKSGYCMTKFGLRGFTESLRSELLGTNVGVTAAYPGPIATGIVRSGRVVDEKKREWEVAFVDHHAMPTERVAWAMIRGIKRNKSRVIIGWNAWGMDVLARLSPTLAQWIVAKAARRMPFV